MAPSHGVDIALDIIKAGDELSRRKNGQAITPDEAITIKAADLLKQIWPKSPDADR